VVNRAAINPIPVIASMKAFLRYERYLVFDCQSDYSYEYCNNYCFALTDDGSFWKGRFK
jgi:hypothetical protein